MTDLADLLRNNFEELNRERSFMENTFVEEPVPLDVFFSDKRFLGNVGKALSPMQSDLVRHAERIYRNDLYPEMAKEFDPKKPGSLSVGYASSWRHNSYWSDPLPMTNILAVVWGKGCLCAGEEIYDSHNGRWLRIDRKSRRGGQHITAYTDKGKLESESASCGFLEGTGECYEVTLSNGARMRVFGGHKYLTNDGWKKLDDLNVGSSIKVATQLKSMYLDGVPKITAEVYGLWLGSRRKFAWSPRQQMKFKDERNDRVMARYIELCKQFNVSRKSTHDLNLQSTFIDDKFMLLANFAGFIDEAFEDVRVPERVFRAPDDVIAHMLARIWDMNGVINGKSVYFNSPSYCLAVDMQRLFLRLGIPTDIKVTGQSLSQLDITYKVTVPKEYWGRFLDKLPMLELVEERAALPVTDAPTDVLRNVRITHIRSIGEQEYWTITVKRSHNYVAGGGTINHNSGKDMCCQVITARVAYLLSCLRSPQAYFDLLESSNLDLLNVAPNSDLAHRVFFKPLRTMISNSPWFREHLAKDPLERTIELNKSILLTSGHSDADRQEGGNLILGIADEIDAFNEPDPTKVGGKAPTKSSKAILKMIRTSGSTRFPDTYKNVVISFPRYLGSPILKAVSRARLDIAAKESEGKTSVYYSAGPAATWDVNPNFDKYERVEVPTSPVPIPNVADIVEMFRDEPAEARAMFLCQPEKAVNPFFKSEEALFECFKPVERQPVEVAYKLVGHSWTPVYSFATDFKAKAGARYAMHADLAVTGDQAGIAMSHVASWQEYPVVKSVTIDGKEKDIEFKERRPVVVVDFVLAFSANKASLPPRDIQIRWARQLAMELKLNRGFNIRRFSCDGFQSVDTLQTLATYGIETEKVSTDTKDARVWKTVADLVYDKRLSAPLYDPLMFELTRLSRLPNGRIDHPVGGAKDIADGMAGSIVGALELGGKESSTGREPITVQAKVTRGRRESTLTPRDFNPKRLSWGSPII